MIAFLAATFLTALKWIGLIAAIGALILVVAIAHAHDQIGHEIDREDSDA